MSEELQEIDAVYIGRRMGQGGKILQGFVAVDRLDEFKPGKATTITDTAERLASMFAFKAGKGPATVGGIYRMRGRLGQGGTIETLSPSSAEFKGMAPGGLVGIWWAKDKATADRKRAKAEEAKAAKSHALEHALEVVARHFAAVGPANRQAFKVMVLDRLDRGK